MEDCGLTAVFFVDAVNAKHPERAPELRPGEGQRETLGVFFPDLVNAKRPEGAPELEPGV